MMGIHSLPTDLLYLKFAGAELSANEIIILRLLARGFTLQEIADKQGKSRETVKSQIRTARGKLHAKNIPQAIAIAVSLDLI